MHQRSFSIRVRPMREWWIVALGHFLNWGIFNCFLLLRMLKSYHCWNRVVLRNLVTFNLLHWILFNWGHLFNLIIGSWTCICFRGLVATALAEHNRLLKGSLLLVIFLPLLLLLFLFVDFMQEGRNAVLLHLFLSCLGDFLQWELIVSFERGLRHWWLLLYKVAGNWWMLVKFGVHFVFHSLQHALIHWRLPGAKVGYLLLFDR